GQGGRRRYSLPPPAGRGGRGACGPPRLPARHRPVRRTGVGTAGRGPAVVPGRAGRQVVVVMTAPGYMLGRLCMVGRPNRPAVAVLQGTGGGGGTPAHEEAPAGGAAGAGKE